MARKTPKRNAKVAKRLAIASALILIVMFIVKEILKENLKELRDSIASAEAQFCNETSQTTISLQILTTQQQIENLNPELRAGSNDPNHDYSALIAQDTIAAMQVQSQMNSDFDSVSRLIDKMPSGYRDLRRLRDQYHAEVQKIDQQLSDTLKPKPIENILNEDEPDLGDQRDKLY
jgi:hypothetical protein